MQACVERRLDCVEFDMKKESAVTVVLAAKGYPGKYPKGDIITFDPLPESELLFRPFSSVHLADPKILHFRRFRFPCWNFLKP